MVSSGKAMEASVKKLAEYVMTNNSSEMGSSSSKVTGEIKIEESDDEGTDTENEVGQKPEGSNQPAFSGK
jgi:hypothetical protein